MQGPFGNTKAEEKPLPFRSSEFWRKILHTQAKNKLACNQWLNTVIE